MQYPAAQAKIVTQSFRDSKLRLFDINNASSNKIHENHQTSPFCVAKISGFVDSAAPPCLLGVVDLPALVASKEQHDRQRRSSSTAGDRANKNKREAPRGAVLTSHLIVGASTSEQLVELLKAPLQRAAAQDNTRGLAQKLVRAEAELGLACSLDSLQSTDEAVQGNHLDIVKDLP